MMNKDLDEYFVTYKQALALKELGFDKKCLKEYSDKVLRDNKNCYRNSDYYKNSNNISAPLYNQAFEFLRNKFNLICCIIPKLPINDLQYVPIFFGNPIRKRFKTYEDAETYLLDKLIEKANEVLSSTIE